MGGYGSGRYGGRATVEATGALRLDIRTMTRGLELPADARLMRVGNVTWSRDGEPWAKTNIEIDIGRDWHGRMRLRHDIEHLTRSTGPQDYTIPLVATRPTYGGLRWWALCPRTWKRAAVLYLPNGAPRFASREGYKLDYATHRMDRTGRLHARGRRLYRKLGLPYGDPYDGLPRPKGMHRGTHERIVEQIFEVEEALDWMLTDYIVRRFGPALMKDGSSG